MSGTAWLVVAHGSRAPQVTDDHDAVCAELAETAPDGVVVRPAFLEINDPSIPDAIDAAVAEGAGHVVLVPYFLHAGNHTRRDIPALMDEAAARHPAVTFTLAAHLGPDPRLVGILADRARAAGEAAAR